MLKPKILGSSRSGLMPHSHTAVFLLVSIAFRKGLLHKHLSNGLPLRGSRGCFGDTKSCCVELFNHPEMCTCWLLSLVKIAMKRSDNKQDVPVCPASSMKDEIDIKCRMRTPLMTSSPFKEELMRDLFKEKIMIPLETWFCFGWLQMDDSVASVHCNCYYSAQLLLFFIYNITVLQHSKGHLID